jgi:hypothetical protein
MTEQEQRAEAAVTTIHLVEGTWGGDWTVDTGPESFRAWVRQYDCLSIVFRGWSTDVDGVPSLFDRSGNYDWIAGGYALRDRLAAYPYERRNLLVHSHGIAPVLYQCALTDPECPAVPIRRLLSVCSPPRKDLEAVAKHAMAAGMIGAWRHIYAGGWDSMARFGQVFDGHWGWRRTWDVPGMVNVAEQGVGHSGLFTPAYRERFREGGHLAFLTSTVPPEPSNG